MQAAVRPGDCGLMQDLVKDVKSYFPMPAGRAQNTLASDLDKACKAGNSAGVKGLAIQLLSSIEAGLEAGTVGSPAVGSTLANALLACTKGLCNQNHLPIPAIDFTPAFGEAGAFAIRQADGPRRVTARAWIRFDDPEPAPSLLVNDNWALWGVDVTGPWNEVTGADPVLLYGWKASSLSTQDPGIGGLQYNWEWWPKGNKFQDDKLHVWVCFADEAALPHPADDHPAGPKPKGRMQREGVLLTVYDPKCPEAPSLQKASFVAPLVSLVRGMLPRNLFAFALRTDTRTPHVGGSPLDFSHFAPVAAVTEGYLEWVVQPPATVVAGEPITPTLQISAHSGSGTPMEKVQIVIAVQNNSGTPAGAFVTGGSAVTSEADGIASFPQAAVNKPGGYTVCATGVLPGFTFEPVCSTMFHARN